MRVKFTIAMAAATAALLIGAFAVPAIAAVTSVGLQAAPVAGHFGDNVDLTPTVDDVASVVPGQFFNVEVFDGANWVTFGEGLTVENTGVVPVQSIMLGYDDASVIYPAQFRTVFLTKASGGTTIGVSAAQTVSALKYHKSTLKMAPSKTVRHAGTRVRFTVSPVSGPGDVKVTISHKGAKTQTIIVTTNEDGVAYPKLRLGSGAGSYKIKATFLGDRFAPHSKSVSKTVYASR
jgi:hypothetical protein